MTKRIHSIALTAVMAIAIIAVAACNDTTVYHHFENTPDTGWGKADTLLFVVPPLAEPGRYAQQVDLRINEAYPFTTLSLVIAQRVFPGNRMKRHTLHCHFSESDAMMRRRGISYYKYSFSLPDVDLRRGDSLRIYIRHDMKRDILPGVSDIGIKMVRKN